MVSCVFLSHKKTPSKQNLRLIFILQPLLVGSEINTTLKETLINITELKVKHNNRGNFLTVFLTGSLTTFAMIWRLILKKIVVALTAKVLKEKTKRLKNWKKIDVAFCMSETSWHGGKGKKTGPQCFCLISPKPLKVVWIYFFLLLFGYICLEWNWKVN